MKYFLQTIVLPLLLLPLFAFAAGPANVGDTTAVFGGRQPANTGGTSATSYTIPSPLANGSTICDLIGVVYHLLFLAGIPAATLALVYAGFKFVWARGRPDEINKAKMQLLVTIGGIAIFFSFFTAMQVMATVLTELGFVGRGVLCVK